MTPEIVFGAATILGWAVAVLLSVLARRDREKARQAETLARHYQLQADDLAAKFKEYGALATHWMRPKAHNKADDFYWLVKIDREDYLFTDEAMKTAIDRAISMRERGWL